MPSRNRTSHLLCQLFQWHTSRWQHELPDLTKPQYAVMRTIAGYPDIEQVDLTEVVVYTKAAPTEILSRVEKQELVRCGHDPAGKRRRLVYLTV